MRRRQFDRLDWDRQIATLKQKAEVALTDAERIEFLRLARELEMATQMANWLSSSELRRPS